MAIANVALTDTFDYWRTVTNSLVVALNDKLIYCNTSNANTVSITPFASRTSNLTVNIITSTSVIDAATGNVASAYSVNTVNQLALAYGAASNNWTNAAAVASNTWANTLAYSTGISATAWANNVGVSGNAWSNTVAAAGNNWSNTVGFSANSYAGVTYSPKISPTFTGTSTFSGPVNLNGSTVFSNTVTINANVASQTLTDGATVNWDVSLGSVAYLTLGGNRAIAAPTNLRVGSYILHIIQDGTGSRTVTWNSVFKWPAGVAPVLTTTGNRRDLFSFVCDGTNLYGSYLPDVR